MTDEDNDQYEPLYPEQLTWAVLLAKWTEFARSAVALPRDQEGGRMRDSVADIITLQAVWFSLQHLEELTPEQQQVGLDRAGVLIQRSEQAIGQRFGDQVPELIRDLIGDAQKSLAEASGR